MADDTLTLALEGDISLADFALAMQRFQKLVSALSLEVDRQDPPSWRVADLQEGSAIATVQGDGRDLRKTMKVITSYHAVGQALERNTDISSSEPVKKAARGLAQLTERPTINRVRFETALGDSVIAEPQKKANMPALVVSFGAIRGTVQTLTNRRGLRFTLYDTIFDRPIACYLQIGQEDIMRGAWGRHALVSGEISRDPTTYHALVIRNISDIQTLENAPEGSYQEARGIFQYNPNAPAELLIRRLRDAAED